MQNPASRIQLQAASCKKLRATSCEHRASSIQYRASSIQHKVFGGGLGEPVLLKKGSTRRQAVARIRRRCIMRVEQGAMEERERGTQAGKWERGGPQRRDCGRPRRRAREPAVSADEVPREACRGVRREVSARRYRADQLPGVEAQPDLHSHAVQLLFSQSPHLADLLAVRARRRGDHRRHRRRADAGQPRLVPGHRRRRPTVLPPRPRPQTPSDSPSATSSPATPATSSSCPPTRSMRWTTASCSPGTSATAPT